jgi:hypothetical protein
MTELICPDCKHPIDSHALDGCQVSTATGEWDRNWRNPCHCKWNRQTATAYAYVADLKLRLDDSLADRKELAERLDIVIGFLEEIDGEKYYDRAQRILARIK